MTSKQKIRKELVEIGKKIAQHGLVIGPGGNISACIGNIVFMKASGKCFEDAKLTDYIPVDMHTGKVLGGKLKPTCEIWMHLACYKVREDVKAVIHTHPPYSVAFAMLDKTLKPFEPAFVAIVSTEVPVLRYILPSTKELANEVKKIIQNHNAILLKNHGLLTVGVNIQQAYYRTLLVENACKAAFVAKCLGKMYYFTKKEVQDIEALQAVSYRREILKKR